MYAGRAKISMKQIKISVSYSDHNNANQKIIVASQDDKFIFNVNAEIPVNTGRQDFAVWLFLPIAMRTNSNIYIEGKGTQSTIDNAKQMSQIWASWMPGFLNDIEISFQHIVEIFEQNTTEDALCFYSGGVDSTYCIGNKYEKENKRLSLLTVQGMDYDVNDEEKFNKFLYKTSEFANFYGNRRLLIKTNAYKVYDKYKINKKTHHITHIFTLTSGAFLFSGYFKNIFIAADYRMDQQHLVSPYGSNSATNFLFNDGVTSLITENDNLARSEKFNWISSSHLVLESLTFCSDKRNRPNNCGVCSKCTRTKFMFLAATGTIPNIFLDMKIYESAPILKVSMNLASNIFLMDLYFCAKNNNTLNLIPGLAKSMNKIKTFGKLGLLI